MSLLLVRKSASAEAWVDALAIAAPDLAVHVWPETGPVEDVEFILAWVPERGLVASFPNLKAVFSLGAGVDHLIMDPTLPADLPVVRMIDPSLTVGMAQYLTLATLRYHRALPQLQAQQGDHVWAGVPTGSGRVGIMGLGELGLRFAEVARALGFDVYGWTRRPREVEGVTTFAGPDGLAPFLSRCDILVCLLPLTAATHAILNATLFAQLPRGACLIHAGRGEHLVEDDLLAALANGQLAGATIDVFVEEPLPRAHPFWDHPQILITPHIASATSPRTAAQGVAENIARVRSNLPPKGLVDRSAGY